MSVKIGGNRSDLEIFVSLLITISSADDDFWKFWRISSSPDLAQYAINFDQPIFYVVQHTNQKLLSLWIGLPFHYASQHIKGMLELVVNCIPWRHMIWRWIEQSKSNRKFIYKVNRTDRKLWRFFFSENLTIPMLWHSACWGCAGISRQLHPLKVKNPMRDRVIKIKEKNDVHINERASEPEGKGRVPNH